MNKTVILILNVLVAASQLPRDKMLQQARISCSPTYKTAFVGCMPVANDKAECKKVARSKATKCARLYIKQMYEQ